MRWVWVWRSSAMNKKERERLPKCIMCGSALATRPKERPLFCSKECGFDAGVMSYQNHEWCPDHRLWHNSECPECLRRKAADDFRLKDAKIITIKKASH